MTTLEKQTKFETSTKDKEFHNQSIRNNKNQNWKLIKLGDVVRSVTINEYDPEKSGLTKYVAGEHIESENLFVTKYGEINKAKDVIGSAFIRRFSEGQILYVTRRAYLRKAAIAMFDGICSNTTLVLETNGKGLISGLLPFILQSKKFVDFAIKASVGSTNPYVRWRDLALFQIPLPSEDIQNRISDILWAVEECIQETQTLIKKTIILKKTLLNTLLNKGLKNTRIVKVKTESKIIMEIPEDWSIKKISELSKINPESLNDVDKFSEEIEYVDISSISDFKINNTQKISLKNRPSRAQRIIRKGDVLISNVRPYLQAFTIVDLDKENLVCSTGFTVIRPNDKLDGKLILLNAQTQHFLQYVNKLMEGGNYPAINSTDIENAIIPYSSDKEERKNIISRLSSIDDKISALNSHLTKLVNLRQSLSDYLLNEPNLLQIEAKIVH